MSDSATLARYLPASLRRRIAASGEAPTQPSHSATVGAVLFCDIGGFTALTERLSAEGPDGVERLTHHLNEYFGRLIGLVEEHGGDVIRFAGDALLAAWTAPDEPGAARRAARCALAVRDELGALSPAPGVKLSVRMAIGAGELQELVLGGALDRWEYIVAGGALEQIVAIADVADLGAIAVSEQTWSHLSADFPGQPADQGGTVLQGGPADAATITPLPVPEFTPEAAAAARVYLSGAVLARHDAGHGAWLGELRRVSVIFARIPNLHAGTDEGLRRAQALVREAQAAVYRWEGTVDKVGVDDKGTTVLAVMGLPPLAHEDDARRAVEAALEIRRRLAALDARCALGVATGRVYCGVVGRESRGEYTVIGRTVNLAARLMGASDGYVLCDQETVRRASDQRRFEAVTPLTLKGFEGPVPASRPTGEVIEGVRDRTELVGRVEELTSLSERLQDLVRQRNGGIVVVEGEAGIGKSRLVEEVQGTASRFELRSLVAAGHAIERSTAYHATRPLLTRLLTEAGPSDTDALRAAVDERLADQDEELRELVPLLNAVLPLNLPDNERTKRMAGEVRAHAVHRLIAALIAAEMAGDPLLLIIEDAHWLDSSTWALLQEISRSGGPVLLLIVTRPLEPPAPQAYTQLTSQEGVVHLVLGALSPDETLELVCRRLGISSLPPVVGDFIGRKAEGHPFFSEELAYALRDAGHITVEDGECHIVRPDVSPDDLALPDTVEGVVVSRVDRLPAQQQLVLKVASVVGREFRTEAVAEVFPETITAETLEGELECLVDAELLTPLGGDGAFMFKHILGQEAVYSLMLYAQRRHLHRAVAGWYEGRAEADPAEVYPLLAHHWGLSDDTQRSLKYLVLAGDEAFKRFANREALRFYDKALAAKEQEGDGDGVCDGISRKMARAAYGAGEMDLCVDHAHKALADLGWPMIKDLPWAIFGLLRNIFLRILQAKFPRFFADPDTRERRLQAVQVQNHLTELMGLRNLPPLFLYSSLRELNIAAPAGDSAELGKAAAMMSAVIGSTPLQGVTDKLISGSRAIGDALGDGPAKAYIYARSAIPHIYRAEFDESDRLFSSIAVPLSDRYSDSRRQEEASSTWALSMLFQGRFAECEAVWARVRSWSTASGNPETQAWSHFSGSTALVRLGRTAEALTMVERAKERLWDRIGGAERIWGQGALVLALTHAGRHMEALEIADAELPGLSKGRPTFYFLHQARVALAECYLELLGLEQPPADRGHLLKQAARACKCIEAFGKVFPFGRPTGLLMQGWLATVEGKDAQAQELLNACVSEADAVGMTYEREAARLLLAGEAPRLVAPAPRIEDVEAIRVFSTGKASDELVQALAAAGVRRDTLPVLHLAPLIEVAWADGEVQAEERELLITAAIEHGVERGSAPYVELERLLQEPPSRQWFERAAEYVRLLLEELPEAEAASARTDLIGLAQAIAGAHGKLFGVMGDGVCEAEALALRRIAGRLAEDRRAATGQVLSRLAEPVPET